MTGLIPGAKVQSTTQETRRGIHKVLTFRSTSL
eukprot:SAG31_NODE_32272_length_357_cov_1.798450_1_plen_32_part_01